MTRGADVSKWMVTLMDYRCKRIHGRGRNPVPNDPYGKEAK